MSNQQTLQELKINGVTYIKLDKIGEGAQGIVYKGKNTQTNEIVAIKEYKIIDHKEETALQALQNQKFKYMIEIKEVFQDENSQTIIIMEFADGAFNEYIETNEYRQLGYDQKNKYFIQIAKGVNQLHKLGLFHRDLKPQNFVYINKPKNKKLIKLIDFGQARNTDIDDTRKSSNIGTPQYGAPEIVTGQYDNQIDIWSLGLIWWEMLTNEKFFGITKKDKDLKFSQQKIYNKINSSKFIQEKENNFLKNMINLDASKRVNLKEIIDTYKKQDVKQINFITINENYSKYRIINLLGQGRESIVYKGQNTQTNEIVAIKEYKQINQNELKAIQAVFKNNFSHIIKIKAVQQHQNWSFVIVMEFADGMFNEVIQTQEYQRLGYNEKNKYFLQMLQGVDQLHNLGLFHRNLNPESFAYIDQPYNQKIIKLIDFGFVKDASFKMGRTTFVQTASYLAPEVISNFNIFYDKSVDIWSLGTIWYEMLTGEKIFSGNQQQIFNQILNSGQQEIDDKIQQNQNIQQKEKDLIKQMLRKFSMQRIQLKDIIAAYIQSYQQQNYQPHQQQYAQFKFSNQQNQNLLQSQIQQKQFQPQFNLINSNIQPAYMKNCLIQLERQNKDYKDIYKKKQEETQKIQQEIKINMEEDYKQQIKEFDKKKEEEREKVKIQMEKKKEKENSNNLQVLQQQQRLEQEFQIRIKQLELKQQQLKAQQQETDKEQLAQMIISSEILFQNEMNQFKKKKEDEQQQQIKQYEQKIKQENEQEIKQKLEAQEKLIKEQLEMDIQNKYLLEYSNKVTELEKKFQQEYQKQLEEKKQSLLILLQSQQNTISMFISNLNQKQDDISKNDSQDTKKKELMDFITNELQKQNQKYKENEQRQLDIQQAIQQEQFEGQDHKISLEISQDIQNQNKVINQITEQQAQLEKVVSDKQKLEQQQKEQLQQDEQKEQLNIEKQKFQQQFDSLQQQCNLFQDNILKIQEKIKFYEKVQYYLEEQEKIQEVIGNYQKMIQDFQVLQQQEKNNNKQFELSYQVISYQSYNSKIEELLQIQNRLKLDINETNKSIEQSDSKFINQQSRQIDDLAHNLNDYQNKFKYLSKNQNYQKQTDLILLQIEKQFGQLNDLNQLLNEGIFQNYQKFNQTIASINKDLYEFQKQHDHLHEQIYHDQQIQSQIQQQNIERIKKLTNIEGQLKEFKNKMNNLKIQINNLINNQYCNNDQTRNLIMDKQRKIDENINQIEEQFKKFQEFNELTYNEIKNQIIYLEEYQEKLKKQLVDEQEQFIQLQFKIQQIGAENKSVQEKEYFQLIYKLQQQYIQFSKALQSINIEQDKIQYFKKIKQEREDLQIKLGNEIKQLEYYNETNQENQRLFNEKLQQLNCKSDSANQLKKIKDLLEKLKIQSQQKTIQLKKILINVQNQPMELKFINMENNLIDQYEDVKLNEQKLSFDVNSILSQEQNQQFNPQSFNELKIKITNLISQMDSIIKIIPLQNQIQQFKNEYQINTQSYEKLYALVNYIMQYHLTRYYERIKENAEKQKNKQQQTSKLGSYITVFQNKQNEQMEENIQKEKEAQDLLMIYENILFNNYNKKMIDEMESDYDKIKKQIEVQENFIKQKNLVKLRACLRDQQVVKEIINDKQYYKLTEFTQMIIFQIIWKQKSECLN